MRQRTCRGGRWRRDPQIQPLFDNVDGVLREGGATEAGIGVEEGGTDMGGVIGGAGGGGGGMCGDFAGVEAVDAPEGRTDELVIGGEDDEIVFEADNEEDAEDDDPDDTEPDG
jgi:hypothetical protein